MSAQSGLSDDTYEALRAEFGDWLDIELTALEQSIDEVAIDTSGSNDQETSMISIMRMAHNIKGSAGAFGFNTITAVAHRMEDFISSTVIDLSNVNYREALLRFVDEMRRISELPNEPTEAEAKSIIRTLPNSTAYNTGGEGKVIEENSTSGKEVLIASPSKTISAITRKVCENLNHRISASRNGIEALTLAVSTKPDIVIVSTILDGISGPDLARALGSIKALQNTKVILISNLDKDHPDLQHIPDTVHIIHQAGNFPMTLFSMMQKIV